jgi:mRNA interferase MazF
MPVQLYGIYLAAFPFLDAAQTKLRPVIVVSQPQGPHAIIVIVPISSKGVTEPVDVTITHWQSAGLAKPSVARIHRLTSFLQQDLISQLGTLNSDDCQNIQHALKNLLTLN